MIDNFNYSKVSIDAYPISTTTIVPTSLPSKNPFSVLANNDDDNDDTVIISNKSQKVANIDNDSLAVKYAISDSGTTGHFLVEGAPITNL